MTKKNLRTILVRSFLAGTIAFANLFGSAFAGEFSPKKDIDFLLEDGRTLKLEKGAEYNIQKVFSTEDGKQLISKVEMTKNGVSRGFLIPPPSGAGENLYRLTYDITNKSGVESSHMNLMKNGVNVLGEHQVSISSGSYQDKILKKVISENEFIPKTPVRFANKSYILRVTPRGGTKIFQKLPGSSKEILFSGESKINALKPFKNTIRVSSSIDVKLEEVVGTSLADGPEFGPLDALLTLWLLYDGMNVAQEILKNYDLNEVAKGLLEDQSHFDHREINKTMRLRYPQLFEKSPIDINPVTGHTIVKNPLNYYSNFPEPYRTYMYNVMKANPKQWGVSEGNLEKAFRGEDYPGKNLGYQLSEEQKKEMQKAGNSSQGYIPGTQPSSQKLERKVEEPQVSYKKSEEKQEPSYKNEGKYSESNIKLAERINNLMSESSELVSKKEYSKAISNYEQLLTMNCEIAGYSNYNVCRKVIQIFSYHKFNDEGLTYPLLDQIEKWNRKSLEYPSSEDEKGWTYSRLIEVYLYKGDKQALLKLYDEWMIALPSQRDNLTASKEKDISGWDWTLKYLHSKVK